METLCIAGKLGIGVCLVIWSLINFGETGLFQAANIIAYIVGALLASSGVDKLVG